MSPEVRALLKLAKDQGWTVDTSGRHIRATWKTGEFVIVPRTPSDPRSLKNTLADMERVSGPLRPKPGNGPSKADRQRRRELQRDRMATGRRRRAAHPDAPRGPVRTAMEAAFDDFFEEKAEELGIELDTPNTGTARERIKKLG